MAYRLLIMLKLVCWALSQTVEVVQPCAHLCALKPFDTRPGQGVALERFYEFSSLGAEVPGHLRR